MKMVPITSEINRNDSAEEGNDGSHGHIMFAQ